MSVQLDLSVLSVTAIAHLGGLADVLELGGHLRLRDDAFAGIMVDHGQLALSATPGLGVQRLGEGRVMARYQLHLVDVFTTTPGLGNRAAVVLDAACLSTTQMQAIAAVAEPNETAFGVPSDQPADYDLEVRYFTRTRETPCAVTPRSLSTTCAPGCSTFHHK